MGAILGHVNLGVVYPRGPKLEHYADRMREILPKIGWLLLLDLVCVLCQSALLNQTVTL